MQQRLHPIRSSLLATISFIYPIELISPPDLLFTIVDVPLPIPLAPTDPAPPLSVPGHAEINEEVVATALGYAAQVVQLLAAYLNKNLTYPITCVGSRSLIRDGISTMVGPRMFPLFSKGVDTYRFEYGVFLLNKNIELLMSDRDLWALDMRHTLPNLKNLLLTLTDPESIATVSKRRNIPFDNVALLQSPSLTSLALESNSSASSSPKASGKQLPESLSDLDSAASTAEDPNSDGEVTPKKSASGSSTLRKSKGYFAPFTSFLRVRYPSSGKTEPDPEHPDTDDSTTVANEHSPTTDAEVANDEDDRRTIRGAVADESDVEGKPTKLNGVDDDPDAPQQKVPPAEKVVRRGFSTVTNSVSVG